MNIMNMPGFTAEASLSKSVDHYRETGYPSPLYVQNIVPQLRDHQCWPDGPYICCYDAYLGYYCFRGHGFPE